METRIGKGVQAMNIPEREVLRADQALVDNIIRVLDGYYSEIQDREVVFSGYLVNETKVMVTYVDKDTMRTDFVFFNTANEFLDWSAEDEDIKATVFAAVREWTETMSPEFVVARDN